MIELESHVTLPFLPPFLPPQILPYFAFHISMKTRTIFFEFAFFLSIYLFFHLLVFLFFHRFLCSLSFFFSFLFILFFLSGAPSPFFFTNHLYADDKQSSRRLTPRYDEIDKTQLSPWERFLIFFSFYFFFLFLFFFSFASPVFVLFIRLRILAKQCLFRSFSSFSFVFVLFFLFSFLFFSTSLLSIFFSFFFFFRLIKHGTSHVKMHVRNGSRNAWESKRKMILFVLVCK